MYFLGQMLGLVGTAVTVARPMFQRRLHMLLCGVLINTVNGLNFLLIGRLGSAVFMCAVAVVQSLVSICHERRGTEVTRWETVLFFLLYTGLGLYGTVSADGFTMAASLRNLLELLPILGALLLMLSVFAEDPQRARLYLLLNGASWMVYTAAAGSTTFFSSCASAVCAAAAMWRYRAGEKV